MTHTPAHTRMSAADLEALPSRSRAHLVNLFSGIKGLHLLGSRSKSGQDNLAPFNSVLHIGASPAALGVLFRPITVRRDSYRNIQETGHFTLNLVSRPMLDAAHHASAKWAADESEFSATGLTTLDNGFPAPHVAESPLTIGLRLVEEQHIRFNDTRLLIGAVEEVLLPVDTLPEGGWMRLDEHDILSVAGLDSYYQGRLVARKAYATPDARPEDLVRNSD